MARFNSKAYQELIRKVRDEQGLSYREAQKVVSEMKKKDPKLFKEPEPLKPKQPSKKELLADSAAPAAPNVPVPATSPGIPDFDYEKVDGICKRKVGHSEIHKACKDEFGKWPFKIHVDKFEDGRTYVHVSVHGGKRLPLDGGFYRYPGKPPIGAD